MHWEGVVPAVVSAGLGAGGATLLAAIVQVVGRKSESRASAANLITGAASSLAQQQSDTITRLEKRVDRQAKVILSLTEVLEELLPQLRLGPTEQAKLRKAVAAARMAV